MVQYLAIGLFASILFAVGLVLMKSRSEGLPEARSRTALWAVVRWLRDPVWLTGLSLEGVGFALYVIALRNAPVSLLAVVMQGGIGLFVVFAVLFLGEKASPWEWVGLLGVLAAMVMLALSLGGNEGPEQVHTAALFEVSIVAVILALAPSIAERMIDPGVAPAIASGIGFGLGSLYVKALVDRIAAHGAVHVLIQVIANPYTYLASAANIAGLVLLQNSFTRSRGLIVMPLSSASSNILPIIGGMIAFGERLPTAHGPAVLRIAAFGLTVVAGALLSIPEKPRPRLARLNN